MGVADPTRHGYIPTGNQFFKHEQAAERYAGKKKAAYAALVQQHSLKKKVNYAPVIFEVSGGFPGSVSQLPSKATEVAGKNKVKLAAADWSWSAMDWSLFHAQVLSFDRDQQDDGSCSAGRLAASSGSSGGCELNRTVVQKHSELRQMPTILKREFN